MSALSIPPATAAAGLLLPGAMVWLLRLRYRVAAPWRALAGAFVSGAAGAFVSLIAEEALWPVFEGSFGAPWRDLFRAFVLIALTEELAKLSLVYARGHDARDPSYAAFVLAAAAIGAGFAGVENLLYLQRFGPDVLSIRLLTATPFHIFNAVLAAWAIARHLNGGAKEWLAGALTLSVLLHGLYDYLLMARPDGNSLFLVALALASLSAHAVLRGLAAAGRAEGSQPD